MAIISSTIKDAMIAKIYSSFPTIPMYEETIQQGALRPYFLISQIDMSQTKESTNKYDRLYQMKVEYDVAINDPETNSKLETMGDALMGILDTISVEVGNGSSSYPVIGRFIDYKIVNDELQFFVSYPIRVYKEHISEPLQGSLKINTKIHKEIGG